MLRGATPDQGPDTAPTPVLIATEGLRLRVVTDFANQARSRVDDTHSARAGNLSLLDVRRVDDATLAATVPAGLAPGVYDLAVTDPFGREVVLPGGWRSVPATAPVALTFTTPATTLQAGNCSAAVSVETRDILGRPALPGAPLSVALAGSLPATVFFTDAACSTLATSITIPTGSVSSTFRFRSGSAGELTLTALAQGLTPATQTHTVLPNAPAALAFTTPPRTVAVGACSAPATLQLQDALGNAVLAPAGVAVGLQVSPSGSVALYSDPACTMAALQADIAAGTSTVDRYARGLVAGASTVVASAAGLNPASQQVTVTAAGGGAGGGSGGGAGGGSGGGAGGGSGGGTGGGSGGGTGGGSGGGAGGGAAAAHVGTLGSASCGSGPQTTITLTGPVPAGDTVIVRMSVRTILTTAISASDSKGNVYVLDADAQNIVSPGARMAVLRAPITTPLATGDTVTITHPDASSRGALADRFTGLASSGVVLDKVTTNGDSQNPSATVLVTSAPALVLAAVSISNSPTITEPTGYTSLSGLALGCGGGAMGNSRSVGGFTAAATTGTYPYALVLNAVQPWAAAILAYRAQ